MNIDQILQNTSAAEHEQFISDLLATSFANEKDEVKPGKRPTFCAQQFLRKNVEKLIASAAANADKVEAVGPVLVGNLAQEVFDKFNEAACEINNGGAEEMVRYLVVEAGCSTDDVVAAAK